MEAVGGEEEKARLVHARPTRASRMGKRETREAGKGGRERGMGTDTIDTEKEGDMGARKEGTNPLGREGGLQDCAFGFRQIV